MTRANHLRSRVKVTFHARFCSGGGTGDRPPDHNDPLEGELTYRAL